MGLRHLGPARDLARESKSFVEVVPRVAEVIPPTPKTRWNGPEEAWEAVRDFLRERLPDHMAPAAYVFPGSLPLMVSGKVDWSALPEPDWARALHTGGHLAPRDALEARLVRVWETVLGVEPVGIGDNFFDLGGHSILAIRLFSEMEAEGSRMTSARDRQGSHSIKLIVVNNQTALSGC